MKLELDKIRTDGGTQPRAALQIDTIEEYAELMQAGVKFPPVTVYFDGEQYWLTDGFHRLAAARHAQPGQPIEADIIQDTLADAQWHSFGVNKTHALRRTHQDIARAVRAAILHPKGVTQSDQQIALHVGVTPPTVAKYRRELAATLKTLESPLRTGLDGRRINTARIGKRPSQAAQPNGRKTADRISPRAHTPIRGHSKPLRMIPLQFCPDNPHTAAVEMGGVAFTERIVVRTVAGEKYDRIVGYTLAAKPEPVPIEEAAGDLADVPF
jgi:hypothetical protein